MEQKKLPVTCPLCGRENEFPVESLTEGTVIRCPVCRVKLTLHGHMLEDILSELKRLKQQN